MIAKGPFFDEIVPGTLASDTAHRPSISLEIILWRGDQLCCTLLHETGTTSVRTATALYLADSVLL